MKIQILGTGCYNCVRLELLVADVLAELGASHVEIERIDDPLRIQHYIPEDEIPGLVIDGVLMNSRTVPDRETLKTWLREAVARTEGQAPTT
ncbi:thioredoxin family protein [Thermoflexus hugenholtzii]